MDTLCSLHAPRSFRTLPASTSGRCCSDHRTLPNTKTCGLLSRPNCIRPPVTPHIQALRLKGHRHTLNLAQAVAEDQGQTYQGMFGPWQIEDSDVQEVTIYRSGLTVAAVAFALGTAGFLLPTEWDVTQTLRNGENIFAALGAAGLGASLYYIHIYVTPLKRFVQALWAAGTVGGLGIMVTQGGSMPEYVAQHPSAVWLVGPFWAAVTGLAFKEGMCYGKPEAAALFFSVPALLLGHLIGAVPPSAEKALAAAVTALFVIFAARKYTQAVKDDIGDKSVFVFQALSEEEKQARIAELEEQGKLPRGS